MIDLEALCGAIYTRLLVFHPETEKGKPHQAEHIRPGSEGKEIGLLGKSEQILKTNFDDETNWNYLFMN